MDQRLPAPFDRPACVNFKGQDFKIQDTDWPASAASNNLCGGEFEQAQALAADTSEGWFING